MVCTESTGWRELWGAVWVSGLTAKRAYLLNQKENWSGLEIIPCFFPQIRVSLSVARPYCLTDPSFPLLSVTSSARCATARKQMEPLSVGFNCSPATSKLLFLTFLFERSYERYGFCLNPVSFVPWLTVPKALSPVLSTPKQQLLIGCP